MKLPVELGLPFPSWRKGQQLAIRTALSAKTPFVAIPAPTGSGKSTIAAALMKLDPRRTVVLTGTKQLQSQYARTFPWMFDIRGMGNYECLAARDEFKLLLFNGRNQKVMCDEGPCRADVACSLKDAGCLYFDRYRQALGSPAVLTSYAYWLSIRRFGKGLGIANRLICDEAHAIPEFLSQAWRIEVPARHLKQAPRTVQGWREWAAAQLEALKPTTASNTQRVRARRDQERYQSIYNYLDAGWVWEKSGDSWVFEPIQIAPLASLLWDKLQQVVFLSATLTPAMFQFLGITADQVTTQALKSQFPLDRRPVYVLKAEAGGVRMDSKSVKHEGTLDRWLETMDTIIDGRTDRHGIIHTVSYARARWIMDHSRHHARMTDDLRVYLAAPADAGCVLVSPVVTTGVDFPYRACEYQIISKVPFPDTRSRIVKARIDAIPHYREAMTMQTIVQSAGRGMRADDDQCETFIIDTHATWFLHRAADFAPRDFLDAITFERRIPAPPKRLQ